MEVILMILAASGVAHLFWFSLGSPGSNYSDQRILSSLGGWIMDKYMEEKYRFLELFFCPVCLTPWILIFVILLQFLFPGSIYFLAALGSAHILQLVIIKKIYK